MDTLFGQRNNDRDGTLALRPKRMFADRFRLLQLLGMGGVGQVWRARDLLLKQEVALKISKHDLTSETLALRRLPKDRYVSIFDYVSTRDRDMCAYSMELLEQPWMTLDDYRHEYISANLDNGENPIEAIRIITQISIDVIAGLRILHGKKYGRTDRWVHADVKPQNIYINRNGAKLASGQEWDSLSAFTKIGDLGLTCSAGAPPGGGTIPYMSPEQRNGGAVSIATDVFAIAQTLTFMILGNPFDYLTLGHVARMKEQFAAKIPSKYLVEQYTDIVRKMTTTYPTQRITSDESVRALKHIINSQEEWKILTLFASKHPLGLNLNDSANFLFSEVRWARNWRNSNNYRLTEIKNLVRSMYKRGILIKDGHRYMA